MGDRISIQFEKNGTKSATLFSHWRGEDLLIDVGNYFKDLEDKLQKRGSVSYPIDRLEPDTIMVDFIRWLTKNEDLIESDLYLPVDETHGDNSDNGHRIIDVGEYISRGK